MPTEGQAHKLAELAARVDGEVLGDPSLLIEGVSGLAEAGPRHLSFYGSPRYRRDLLSTRAAAVLVGSDAPERQGLTYVRVQQPHLAFARISAVFHPRPSFSPGTSPGAVVHPQAGIHPSATLMAGATVERGARVGARTVLFPGVFLGEEATVGDDCVLYPNVVVRERCSVGSRVILHPCAVIGADGFGFAFDANGPEHVKVPQAGSVRIEDDVEIGACTCVDRGTVGDTVVRRGSKLDNLIQIAHNVQVGPLAILCAQTGIAGSTEIGAGVYLGGQAGVSDHLKVGSRVKVGVRALIAGDIEDGQTVSGYPAIAHKEWLRSVTAFKQLGSLLGEVRKLRARVEALEEEEKRR